jgi:2'-5' RNA ligase
MAFFAIPIPSDLQAQLAEGLASLKKDWPDVQWVHADDYHLTLRFLGGLHPDAMTRLMTDVQGKGLPFKAFTVDLQGISSFPPHRDRGVLWIDLKSMAAEMVDLQARLEQQAQALGFKPDNRPFTAHLTIGRFKKHDEAGLMEVLPTFSGRAWGNFTCHEYVLMKRRSGARDNSGRPLYEVLARFSV